MSSGVQKKTTVSLRLRLIVLAALVLAISLGLVGLALDSAFHKSTVAGLKTRMESLVYLVLAATEVREDGTLILQDEPGDPRLNQPGSGVYAQVNRCENIHVRALDQHGEPFEMDADGLLGICIQHEIDHLDGKVFVDYLSHLKQDRIRKKMQKTLRHS